MCNDILTKEKLEQLIENVKMATSNPDIVFFPLSLWIKEMENYFERFYMSEDFGLMWCGYRVGVIKLNNEKELMDKWKELNKLKN
jgi:hypothetical protein